jgi:hypothetical protein
MSSRTSWRAEEEKRFYGDAYEPVASTHGAEDVHDDEDGQGYADHAAIAYADEAYDDYGRARADEIAA